MTRSTCALVACLFVIAGAPTLAVSAGPAAAAVPCGQRVLEDWSDNGRVDRVYDLRCYDDAIEALPADLRDYTDAAEVIERALASATRARSVSGEFASPQRQAAAASPTAFPVVPLLGGGFALVVLLAGVAAYLARRRGAA